MVKEIRDQKKSEAVIALTDYQGRNVRDLFAANLVEKYAKIFFGNDLSTIRILDYGSASGAFTDQLHKKGFRNLYGLDLDNYLKDGKNEQLKEFRIADLNADKLPWPDNYFDIVTAWCVLPHLENPHHCIRETLRILRPGGAFILSVPNLSSKTSKRYFFKKGDFARYLPSTNHISIFTPGVLQNTILKYFQKSGLEYLMDPRIFQGLKGKIRKVVFDIGAKVAPLRSYLEKLWGYNQIWILRK